MSIDDRDVLLSLTQAALEATTREELDERAFEVLEPALGEGPTRKVLAGDPEAQHPGDEPGLVRDVAVLLASARSRLEARERLRESYRELAASERLVRLLLQSAGEGIYAVDLEGRCTVVNREALRLLGYDHEDELLGRNMHRVVHHTRPDGIPYPEEECRIFQAYREGRGVVCDDEVLFRRDGSSFPVEYRSYPILKDGNVQGSVLSFVDITERIAAQERLRQLHAERRAAALSLHDNVVQAVATANYARSLGEDETSVRALEEALRRSQALVTQLLADSPVDEHLLVRADAPLDEEPST